VPAKLLTEVLEQTLHIRQLIRRSAAELSRIGTGTGPEQDRAHHEPPPAQQLALDPNQAIATTLAEAADGLTAVTQALQNEIRDRTLTDHQWAAAVEQQEASRNAALHDILTGLPNRMLFKDRLEHGIAQATRHRWILGVMFVDLDHFKGINDTYGHQAGDAVLQIVARRLTQTTRQEDTVSRYGGDEFLALLTPLEDQKDIAMIAAKILKALQAPCEVPVGEATVTLQLQASIGIAMLPTNGVTASELIESADAAMYGAKQTKSGFAFAA
jgi:diguanylate cyclase (GGDEF)-like protein